MRRIFAGFLVETDRPGFSAHDIHGKWSLRASVTSGLTLQDVHVPEANLLPGAAGLKSPLMCLNQARYGISWGAHRRGHGLLLDGAELRENQKTVPQSADCQPSTGAGKAGVDGELRLPRRNCCRSTWAG